MEPPRKPRRRTSQSWYRAPSERRELDIAPLSLGALDLIRARMAECGGDPEGMGAVWREAVARDVHRIVSGAWEAGAAREAELRTALDGERELRRRLEQFIRDNGLRVPTEPLPSDPPARE